MNMETTIIVALLGTITTLITAVLVAWTTRKQAVTIEKLKTRLEQESREVNKVIAWLFDLDTDTIHQYRLSAREFLWAVQYAKDQLRNIAATYHLRFPEERTQQLLEIRKILITKYADTRYDLDKTYYTSHKAHQVKGALLHIIQHLLSPIEGIETYHIQESFMQITGWQQQLREGIEMDIQQLCSGIRNKVNSN